jgi:hypothetical protein
MAELLRSLRDSQLVARFQRRCGLFPAREVSPREKGLSKWATGVPEVSHLSDNRDSVSAVGEEGDGRLLTCGSG